MNTLLFQCGHNELLFVLAFYAMTKNLPVTLVLFVGLLYFFRSPDHDHRHDVVTAPSYGTVQRIAGNRIEIILNVFDVHIQYIPYKGTVASIKHFDGKLSPVLKDYFQKSDKNERCETVFDTELGEMKVIQYAGLVARRIYNNLKPKQYVQQGDIMGMIKFSSRVDIFLPKGVDILVKEGDKVEGTHTVLAVPKQQVFG
jgi:phosphatidylserine decarboxylase